MYSSSDTKLCCHCLLYKGNDIRIYAAITMPTGVTGQELNMENKGSWYEGNFSTYMNSKG